MSVEAEIRTYLQAHEETLRPLAIDYCLKTWSLSNHATPEGEQALVAAKEKYLRVFADRRGFARLKDWRREAATTDAIAARQLELIYQNAVPYQIDEAILLDLVERETQIENTFNTFRATFEGQKVTDNQLREVLKQEVRIDRRRAAWEATKQIGQEVAGALLELVRIRNREAAKLGYSDYYSMMMELSELDEAWLFGLFDRLEHLSESAFTRMKGELDAELKARFGVSEPASYPWLYSDPFFQEFPATDVAEPLNRVFETRDIEELTRTYFRSIGLDIDDMIARSDLYERDGKSQHAFCIDIDHSGDVRVLCNVRGDERWMSTMLHEFGHAVYDKYHDPNLPFSLRAPAHTFTTEAIAMLNGRMSKNEEWLVKIAGVPPDQARVLGGQAATVLRSEMLIVLRWIITLCRFERELYRDPSQDLNGLWWRLVERTQKVTPPPGRNQPDWASKIHLAASPVYYQNYLLGELMASQLLDFIRREVVRSDSLVGHAEVGRFFIDKIFRPGARYRWDDLLRRATRESLNPDYFVRQFVTG